MREISPLQKERLNYQPKLAGALANGINAVKLALGEATTAVADKEDIKNLFPNVYGKPITSAHQTAVDLYNSVSKMYTLTMPDDHKCCCIKWSNMAIKLIKPYIKNKFIIEQISSNSHYMLVDSSINEQLLQIQPNNDIQLVDTYEIEICYRSTVGKIKLPCPVRRPAHY